MGILTHGKPRNRERESAHYHITDGRIVLRMDETETVLYETETVLYVCETMTLEDLISMTLEDLILSHVSIYVCVVSLITNLFP